MKECGLATQDRDSICFLREAYGIGDKEHGACRRNPISQFGADIDDMGMIDKSQEGFGNPSIYPTMGYCPIPAPHA